MEEGRSTRKVALLIGIVAILGMVMLARRNPDGSWPSSRRPKNDADVYTVPDGDVPELVEFLKNLPLEHDNDPEVFAQRRLAVSSALVEGANRILAQQPYESAQIVAIKAQLIGLAMQAQAGDEKSLQRLRQRSDEWAGSENSEISYEARFYRVQLRRMELGDSDSAAARWLVDELASLLGSGKKDPRLWTEATSTAIFLAQIGETDLARESFRRYSQLFAASGYRGGAGAAQQLEDSLKKLDLVGQPLEIEGTTLDGQELDWNSLRGKFVLVDFWATWCGPCMEDLPRLKECYEKFNPKGFEIVGVCLDEFKYKSNVQQLVKQEGLTWPMLFGTSDSNSGTELPLAQKYEVHQIPMAILVDRDGKVITPLARGATLSILLAKLLDESKPADGVSSKAESTEPTTSESASRPRE